MREVREGPDSFVMSSDTIADLQRQQANVDAELADARRQVKAAKQLEKDRKKARTRVWALSSLLKHTVLIVFVLTGYKPEPIVNFLSNSGRRRHWPEKTEEELLTLARDLFLEFSVEELAALTDMEGPSDLAAMRSAVAFVQEWGVVVWTRQQNAQCGDAPCTEFVLQQFEEDSTHVPAWVRPVAVGVASDASARMRICRWRKRWGGRVGRVRVREDVQPAELRLKAFLRVELACW